jgi:hypothetical protein
LAFEKSKKRERRDPGLPEAFESDPVGLRFLAATKVETHKSVECLGAAQKKRGEKMI